MTDDREVDVLREENGAVHRKNADLAGALSGALDALRLGLTYAEEAMDDSRRTSFGLRDYPGLYARAQAYTAKVDADCKSIRAAIGGLGDA